MTIWKRHNSRGGLMMSLFDPCCGGESTTRFLFATTITVVKSVMVIVVEVAECTN